MRSIVHSTLRYFFVALSLFEKSMERRTVLLGIDNVWRGRKRLSLERSSDCNRREEAITVKLLFAICSVGLLFRIGIERRRRACVGGRSRFMRCNCDLVLITSLYLCARDDLRDSSSRKAIATRRFHQQQSAVQTGFGDYYSGSFLVDPRAKTQSIRWEISHEPSREIVGANSCVNLESWKASAIIFSKR